MQSVKLDLRQYITNGFIRLGFSYFLYGLVLGLVTLGIGYGTYALHQKGNLMDISITIQIIEYLLLVIVGVLILSCLSLFYKSYNCFMKFRSFMKCDDVFLESHQEPMSIGIALEYLNGETILYENPSLVITEKYLIVLKGQPCIKLKSSLKCASLDTKDVPKGKTARINQLKTVRIEFKDKQIKKVNCHYIQEANDILKVMKDQKMRVM